MHVDANIPYGCLCTHLLHIWILKQLCPDLYIRKQGIPFRGCVPVGKSNSGLLSAEREVKHAQFYGKIKNALYSHYSDSSDQVDHI